jgi:predicted nucleic-acid-binding Zn-ribbon protein
MGLFRKARPRLATVRGRALQCLVCGGGEFWDREVKLNSTGMEFLNLAWANRSALGLLCARCGYVHEFVGDAVKLWDRDGGYPAGVGRSTVSPAPPPPSSC